MSTSTVGFLGLTERGPTIPPKLVTSWTQFMRVYGGYAEDAYLPYAVEGFFGNGGKRCYIARVVHRKDGSNDEGAVAATLTKDGVTFKAVGEGSWGNRVAIRVENSSNANADPESDETKTFKLTIVYWKEANFKKDNLEVLTTDSEMESAGKLRELLEKADYLETFDNLSTDPTSSDHFTKKLGDPLNNLSNLLVLSGSGRPSDTDLDKFYFEALDGGSDGTSSLKRRDFLGDPTAVPGTKEGLTALGDIDEISILCAPDLHQLPFDSDGKIFINDLLTQCENLKDRFAILDVGKNKPNVSGLTITSTAGRQSKYGAIYYPWLKVYDPLSRQIRQIPPGGHVAGIYARSDTERGVHKAPANEVVRGALGLEFDLTKDEQSILNPRGINVIRNFTDRGILVWGARNIVLDPLWKYINVRRLFIYVEGSIEKGTQWVVFEPNNERLWARVRATITQFLTTVWKDGALMGTKPEEAFFVKCDRTTMTQDDIDNGRLICVIGIAPVKPAEFVIFRIAQWAGGSSATE
ncbi:phage tail sheath C-terminal domain-containing protein [uncultured Methanomethylovorans sp.]|uniref:phage tail sheath family protein n=1 Tax=uncultured Methanomethylovorans sp. TaxID=183759 RepID=UPI00262378B0|nr:phage tail sheath C-terminal domain-containing protein [uncultured Methanomethylovorans sp.]